jgi:anion-transporting  ArsA/GET3 family ATPase
MVAPRIARDQHAVELLPEVPAAARLHIVTGKGGTGKTTTAAALALALASGGRQVLLIEVEGRQALAQLFDLPPLPYAEQRLISAPGGGALWGLAIDAEQAMIEYLDMFYGLKRSARSLDRMGAVDFVTTLAPGLRDVLLTGKVKESVTRTNADGHLAYDAVVLDGPPTGRIGKFLDATREVANLARFGPIHRQSAGVVRLLHSPQAVIHLVTMLEEMPVQETLDAAAELSRAGFSLGMLVVNRAGPALIGPEDLDAAGQLDPAQLSAGLRRASVPAGYAPALAAEVAEYVQRRTNQSRNSERLANLDLPRVELPDLNPPVELGELHELAAQFTR